MLPHCCPNRELRERTKLCIVGQLKVEAYFTVDRVSSSSHGHLLDSCVRTTYSIGEREVVSQ